VEQNGCLEPAISMRNVGKIYYGSRKTNEVVADISLEVGYDNTSYFHRIFKEYYHMTPRAYRIKNGKNTLRKT